MISKLKTRFLLLISAFSFGILFLLCLVLNLTLHFQTESVLRSNIATIYSNYISSTNDAFDDEIVPRYFVAFSDASKEDLTADNVFIDKNEFNSKTDDDLINYVLLASHDGHDDFGRIKQLYYSKFQYDERYDLYLFVDARSEITSVDTTLYVSIGVSAAAFISISVLGSIFAGKAISPYVELEQKEKMFLTDASHELKTPLSIISANADALSITIPNDEYVTSIKKQAKRMSILVNDMVSLYKTEELLSKKEVTTVDLTELLLDATVPFQKMFLSKNVKVSSSIADSIKVKADETSLMKLFTILIENATKYVNENGKFELKLYEDKKFAYIVFYNTCEKFDLTRLPHIFDRFYSLDPNRSRSTSGYGIGLSIAEEIVLANKGDIKALSSTGKDIAFFIRLKK